MAKQFLTEQDVYRMLEKIMRNTQPGMIMNLTDVRRLMRLGDISKLELDGRIREDTSEEVFYKPQVLDAIEKYFYSLPKSGKRTVVAIPAEAVNHESENMEDLLPKIRA